jgi:hypothetical protein
MSDPSDASHLDPVAPNAHTVLRMVGVGVPPYSARGLKQTIAPIDQATNLKRTVNGGLVDISFNGFRKYKSTISGTDQRPPNFDGKWPGLTVIVDCIAELSYAPTMGELRQRLAVPDSEHAEGAHTVYRPRLTMKIMSFSQDHDEYASAIGWSLDLEEI